MKKIFIPVMGPGSASASRFFRAQLDKQAGEGGGGGDLSVKELLDSIELKLSNSLDGKATVAAKAEFKALSDKITELEGKDNSTELEAIKTAATELKTQVEKLDVKMQKVTIVTPQKQEKSFNQILAEAVEEKTDDLNKFIRKETKSFSLELKAVGDMTTGNVTGGNRYGQVMAPGIIESQKRKVHIDQILPGGNVGPGNSFTFMRENGVGEGNAAPVAEGAAKAQLDLDLIESTVQIETIAGFVRFTRKAMNNIPGFISFLQSRLPERFRRVLDAQILYGDGATPNLKGILTAGNFVASTATLADPLIEKLIDDIAKLEDTYERDANGILLRPKDYYSFFKNKATGSGEYDLPQGVTIEGGQLRVLGVPAWASTAITSPDYVVGDFQNGAQLLTQEAMHVEFFEQDADNVTKNKVTARIEGNYALPVYGPDYFIKGTTAQA
jgi:HK97 family phage major capsid protein